MDCWTLLLNGDLFNAAVCPFTSIAFFGEYFYMLIILALEIAIYIKTEDIMIPSILGVIISGSVIAATITVSPLFFRGLTILLAINFAVVLYSVYKGARS